MAGSWKKIRGVLSVEKARSVIFDPGSSLLMMVALFVMEIFMNVWVIQNIKCAFKLSTVVNTLVLIHAVLKVHYFEGLKVINLSSNFNESKSVFGNLYVL